MEKKIKSAKGYGVVGTWLSPKNSLGGALPIYISHTPKEAKDAVKANQRMMQFQRDGMEYYLCEITIKPITKIIGKLTYEDMPVEVLKFHS